MRDALGQDRRRQGRAFTGLMGQIALVEGDVLDSDDPLVRLQLGDAIDQQKGIAMRKDVLDDGVIQWQAQVIHESPV